VTVATAVAYHRQITISLTSLSNVKSPDFPGFPDGWPPWGRNRAMEGWKLERTRGWEGRGIVL